MLLMRKPEFIESVLDILFDPESTKRSTMVGLEEKFLKQSFEMAGKRYFDIGVCKYSKYFLYILLIVTEALYSLKLSKTC